MIIIEKLEKRIGELRESLVRVQNNANAHIGAIQELERLIKEIKDGVSASQKAGSDTANVPGNPA